MTAKQMVETVLLIFLIFFGDLVIEFPGCRFLVVGSLFETIFWRICYFIGIITKCRNDTSFSCNSIH